MISMTKRAKSSSHLKPGERLGGEDEPVVPRATLHEAEIGDGHVALADHLIAQLAARLGGVFTCLLRTILKTEHLMVSKRYTGNGF